MTQQVVGCQFYVFVGGMNLKFLGTPVTQKLTVITSFLWKKKMTDNKGYRILRSLTVCSVCVKKKYKLCHYCLNTQKQFINAYTGCTRLSIIL